MLLVSYGNSLYENLENVSVVFIDLKDIIVVVVDILLIEMLNFQFVG